MKSWIKWGVLGAVIYTVTNFVLGFVGLVCELGGGCRFISWAYFNLFPGEWMEDLYYQSGIDSEAVQVGMVIVADAVVGFILGALLAVILNKIIFKKT